MIPPKAPKHFSRESKALWRSVLEEFDLEPQHRRILRLLCEALDRAAAAQGILNAEGLVATDRFGQKRAHPMVAVKRDAEIASARLLRELNLEGEALPDPRLPRQPARRSED